MTHLITLLVIILVSSSTFAQGNLKTVSVKQSHSFHLVESRRSGKRSQTENIKFGLDGRMWKMLNEPNDILQKMTIVRGIYDGLMFGRSPFMDLYYTKTSLDHLVNALDQFYQDYRNEKILIVYALRIISMELRGESKDAVDTELRRLRKLVSEH